MSWTELIWLLANYSRLPLDRIEAFIEELEHKLPRALRFVLLCEPFGAGHLSRLKPESDVDEFRSAARQCTIAIWNHANHEIDAEIAMLPAHVQTELNRAQLRAFIYASLSNNGPMRDLAERYMGDDGERGFRNIVRSLIEDFVNGP